MEICIKRNLSGDVVFFFGFEKDFPKDFEDFKDDFKNFEGKTGSVYSTAVKGKPYKRISFYSLGKKEEFEDDFLRRGGGAAIRMARYFKYKEVGIVVPNLNKAAQLITEGAILANYKCTEFKSKVEESFVERLILISDKDIKKEVRLGEVLASAQNYMRSLDEKPANIITPSAIVKEALNLAKTYNLKATVFDEKKLKKMGMNALLAVGAGSKNPPYLVILEYEGAKRPYCAVVGKGITFDSGGISIKPSAKMHEMKYDKSGALAALATIKAVAELKLPIRLLAVLPLAENLPSATAQRPGDIWKAYNGKTIEVLNTDAEGRLILADALSYIAEKKPDYIIDIATLTGAIIIALGRHAAGLFSNDDELAKVIEDAGKETFERVWRLPIWKEYSEMMKSDIADIKNISDTGEAGSITGAVFLKEFVGDTKWAHLDIAGVDLINTNHPYLEKGASGAGVRLLATTFIKLSEKSY
ncbi:MAG: leucyl aminopeptidase [Candidatus Bilamarchaeaceae archaeon]